MQIGKPRIVPKGKYNWHLEPSSCLHFCRNVLGGVMRQRARRLVRRPVRHVLLGVVTVQRSIFWGHHLQKVREGAQLWHAGDANKHSKIHLYATTQIPFGGGNSIAAAPFIIGRGHDTNSTRIGGLDLR